MNVNDFDIEIPKGDKLKIIFDHQRGLMNKYHPIEEKMVGNSCPSTANEHGPFCGPLNIQDRASQIRLKDFAWRITEELAEATECLPIRSDEQKIHYLEELIDALHFMVEFLLMSGVSENDFLNSPAGDRMDVLFDTDYHQSRLYDISDSTCLGAIKLVTYEVVENLGLGMNRLKLKPWKSTAILTDEKLYRESSEKCFISLISLLKISGFTSLSATQMYLNKNAVNQFRIRTNY